MTTSALDEFRLRLGDVDSNRPLFNDTEAQFFIDEYPDNLLLAVADACDTLASRFASDYDFEWKGSTEADGKFSRSQASKQYAAMAIAFRTRAASATGPLYCFPAAVCLDF